MEAFVEILKVTIPIIVGALIAIIPTMIEKRYEGKNRHIDNNNQRKQEIYVELISLFSKVLKAQQQGEELNQLRDKINLISITGSVEVVKALNEYIDTWSKSSSEEQSMKYTELLKVIRVDLNVDKTPNDNFPEIGLRDIDVNDN